MNISFIRSGLTLFSLLLFGNAWAATAVIAAVQMPAWLERSNRIEPLLPGQQVLSGDTVRTGPGARAYIKLPEGSTVKLGESALLTYKTVAQDDSIFRAALNVATGAFRYTTAALYKFQKRDVAIRISNATIGIRGTDVWGRSGKDGDLVMLIEGHVDVTPIQGEVVPLTESMAVFTAPKDGLPNPLTKATWDQFAARARETDIEKGDGALRSEGKVKLLLGSFDDESAALSLYDQARAAGFGAKIRPISGGASATVEGGNAAFRYEVTLYGFADKAEAAIAAARLKSLAGIETTPAK